MRKRSWCLGLFFVAFTMISGCATKPKGEGSIGEIQQFRVEEEPTELTINAQTAELETIPIEINEKVEMWIKYFQTRGRPHMERYLARSTRYEALMKKVLRDNGLPEDLFYIALIESGFSSSAFSSASAVGYWQFIRGTGKRYKLQIDKMMDERRDPVLATQAAADYFKALYNIFDSWYLSMAAYNVGEGRVLRVVKKYKTKDFWELSRVRRALPRETDNYVPKYLAAKLIAKNPDKYGFDGIDYMPPIEFDHIKFQKPMNVRLLAEKMNINYEDFKDLNPKFKGEIAPTDKTGVLELRIPPGMETAALAASTESVANIVDFVPDQVETQVYLVKRGDTFSTLARKFKTNIAYLREINDFPRKKKLRLGQKIFVPDRTPLRQKRAETKIAKGKAVDAKTKLSSDSYEVVPQDATTVANAANENEKPSYIYIVKSGDSLSSIANRYKVSIRDLIKVNNLDRRGRIRIGAKLTLPENAVFENKSTLNKSNHKHKVAKQSEQKRKVASDVKNYKMKMKKAPKPKSLKQTKSKSKSSKSKGTSITRN